MRTIVFLVLVALVTACGGSTPTTVVPTAVAQPSVALGSYRPLEQGDVVEGAKIAYQYRLPPSGQPAIQIAFSENLIQLGNMNPQMTDGVIAFAKELTRSPLTLDAFDETDPNQTAPKPTTIPASKPVEMVVLNLSDATHAWSVTETQNGETRSAYKLVRRRDGGLRFILAFDLAAMNSISTLLPGGGGAGLVISSRLALLRLIVTDQRYQRGENVLSTFPPDLSQYDPRVLKTDPSKEGLAQNVSWAITTRPGPNPGLQVP